MQRFKKFFGYQEEKQDLVDQIDGYLPSLSFKIRFYGFMICGFVSIFLLIISIMGFVVIGPIIFALLYTVSNILLLLATGFLSGFIRQFRYMLKEKRIFATIVFFMSMIITLIVIFTIKNIFLIILCVILQICAYLWYVISYIPYARNAIKSCFCQNILYI